ncbi:MAG: hypothetical protein ACNA8R_02700 [Nitriliruptoraceae bacterium]
MVSELPARARGARHAAAWQTEDANTLILVPVAILVLFGLAAVALDSATIFLGQRRLVDVASAVANDAVAAVDLDAYYAQGDTEVVPLDRDRAAARRDQLVARQGQDRSLEELSCRFVTLEDGPPSRVEVLCTASVRPILAPLWPGAPRTQAIQAREVAVGLQE